MPETQAAKTSPLTPPFSEPGAVQPRTAVGLVVGFALGKLLMHLLTTWFTPYGIHRDEFLYLSMGAHLQFWRMDFPPAIAVLAETSRFLFGDTLFAVRFFPAVAGTLLVILTALLTREFGGERFAQGLAMAAVLLCALFLRPAALFQPVVFDQLCWTLGFFALAKIARSPQPKWWWLLGAAGGLGLLTKFSIGFFGLGVSAGLLLTPSGRRALRTPWPYVAATSALALGSASIIGQVRLDFPVLLQMTDLHRAQLARLTYLDFLSGQVLMLGPAILLAGAGLIWLLLTARWRSLSWTCVAVGLVLMVLHGKAYYAGPIYPLLFAAGAAGIGSLPLHHRRIVNAGVLILLVAWSGLSIVFGLPLLPPPQMARFAAAVGLQGAVTTNRGKVLPLPQDYADMLGWEEQVAEVAKVYAALPPEQQNRAMLLARNYGEAGALEFFGPRHGLPPRVLLPGNDLLWAPPPGGCDLVVSVGISTNDLAGYFRSVQLVSVYDNPWRVPEERGVPICIAAGLNRNLDDAWPTLRRHRQKAETP